MQMVYMEYKLWTNFWIETVKLKNKFSTVVEYKVKILKLVVLLLILYVNRKWSEIEIKKVMPLTTAQKLKDPGMNLIKEVRDLYNDAIKHWWK